MILATTDDIPGMKITKTLGLVRAGTTRTRGLGRDILAVIKNCLGGEVREYTKLVAEAREQSLDRLKEEAQKLDANAIVGLRFASSEVMSGVAEIVVYGTAVVAEEAETEASLHLDGEDEHVVCAGAFAEGLEPQPPVGPHGEEYLGGSPALAPSRHHIAVHEMDAGDLAALLRVPDGDGVSHEIRQEQSLGAHFPPERDRYLRSSIEFGVAY